MVEIVVRGDSHYARPEAMSWLERNRVRYVFGLAGNRVLLDRTAALAEDAAVRRAEEDADKIRRFGDFRYAAKSWKVERRVIARIEATRQGSDTRFVVTNLSGTPRWLYEVLYCGRGPSAASWPRSFQDRIERLLTLDGRKPDQGPQAAPRLRPDLLLERDGQPVPPSRPHRRLLAAAHAQGPGIQDLVLARRAVRHAIAPGGRDRPSPQETPPEGGGGRLAFVKIAARVTELVTRIKVSLPSSYPYKQSFARFVGRAQAMPP